MRTLRLALAGLSVLALTGPSLAQGQMKPERAKAARHQAIRPPATQGRPTAPIRSGTDWDILVGGDRASSPYAHAAY